MGHEEHRERAPRTVACAVVTVSDTRTEETDTSGAAIRALLGAAGHAIASYRILKDEPTAIIETLRALAASGEVDAVILNGGTGISRRDSTFEAVSNLLMKRIEGFGEIFRALSFQEIGAAAMLSRAVAGLVGERGMVVFSIPGSEAAVRLAMERLILPEIGHVVYEMRR